MSDLLAQGLELAMYGMGTVFIFLTLLVMVTVIMSRIILAMDVATVDEHDDSKQRSLDQDRRLVAVITAAVQRYRSEHG
ncbi:MAG: OadG family protein [Pseudomonadales bacterium]|jgi:oxaloacetate decarboxylase gamma subunit|nr:OadG family protein [Pseudomonadales bacterium]MDP7145514.1 OadG family protein [Pseudomonadales bacterium]MDP7358081.1 OadG family protein [Pseudomonadales bacterium]HJN51227.1 OadG family protein [Pseudomonadales bacterium]|tara:strand:+ start:288 stop:524 length:237 start_codon:yes stop_codon:yes gene_type:complete